MSTTKKLVIALLLVFALSGSFVAGLYVGSSDCSDDTNNYKIATTPEHGEPCHLTEVTLCEKEHSK